MLDSPLNVLPHLTEEISLPDPLHRYSPFLFQGFARYLKWYLKRHFHSVGVSLSGLPRIHPDKPLIIYSNHPSWWDPLLFALVGDALFPGHRGYGPMEARSLKRYAVLERLGAFAIDLESARGGLAFMIQAKRILATPSSILWITAEGAFTDVRRRPITIQQGLGYLVRMLSNVVVVPLAVEYPFWNESRPEALCRFGNPIDLIGIATETRSAAHWNAVFQAALSQTMDRLSEEAIQRDSTCFRCLLQGGSGVGGVYDGLRRLKAWSEKKRFDPSHGRTE